MKSLACVLGWILASMGSVHAQSFVNLGFEDIRFTPPDPPQAIFLSWDQAAPGWSHSEGDSTEYVSYLLSHLGFSQNYVLLDRSVADSRVISGSFAMSLHGGTFHEQEPRGDYVQAFIEQRGLIPAGTATLRLLANGHRFSVTLDGAPIDMRPDGLDPASPTYEQDLPSYAGGWSADISSFAGRIATLRIADADVPFATPQFLVVDDIRLLPVPEPSTAVLLLAGLLAGAGSGKMRFRRGASRPPRP